MDSITLIYFKSTYIVDFIAKHPVSWPPKEMSGRGGYGDQAGVTPTPAVAEFLALLRKKVDLFTQDEYFEHCCTVWAEWLDPIKQRDKSLWYGVKAKLHGNFYPSMIDTLHVHAMLVEAGVANVSYVNSFLDAVGKIDLTVIKMDRTEVRLALIGPTQRARDDLRYKREHRANGGEAPTVDVHLPWDRARKPGNKRWYCISDFDFLWIPNRQMGLPFAEPATEGLWP